MREIYIYIKHTVDNVRIRKKKTPTTTNKNKRQRRILS
jgi:hypothetical protein